MAHRLSLKLNAAHLLLFATQMTVTRDGKEVELRGKGRHDPCVLPRAVPMVEAMVALVLVDHLMMQRAQCELFPRTATEADRPNPMGKTARREGGPIRVEHVAASGPISQRVDEE
jgi:chorismate synthase